MPDAYRLDPKRQVRFNCAHTFTLEAEDRQDFDAKLKRYSEKVRKASERLDIGYAHSIMWGQPDMSDRALAESEPPNDEPVETLFDG